MKIGNLASKSGCTIQAIRFYEKAGLLLPPKRSEGNFRLYSSDALNQLLFIKHFRELDLSLEDIGLLIDLQQSPEACCDDINKMIDMHIQQVHTRMKALRNLKSQLKALRLSCGEHQSIKECGILQGLSEA